MDIAVGFDCSSSMSFYANQIRKIILSVLHNALPYQEEEEDIRMALIKFQSHTDDWVTEVHPFTTSIDIFQQWLNDVETTGENFNECKAIADALNVSLTLDWHPHNDSNQCREKILVLFTDGPPCNLLEYKCACNRCDLWRIADRLADANINLIVIGIEPCIVVCDDFYCALAQKTGGQYVPIINALHVLSLVIQQAILGEYTISYLLRRLNIQDDIEFNALYNYASGKERVRYMIEYCRTINDIRKELYTYRQQSTEVNNTSMEINMNDSNHELHFSPIYINYWNDFHRFDRVLTSTPITDDEGYRTRLPTTASAESSFICVDNTLDCYQHMDINGDNEIDDEFIYSHSSVSD